MDNSNNIEFIKLYKEVDQIKTSDPQRYFRFEKRNKATMDSLRHARNLLEHTVEGHEPPIYISDSLLHELKKVITRINSLGANVYIKFKEIKFASPDNSLNTVYNIMKNGNFSYMPILDNGQYLIGVITEKLLLDLYAQGANKDSLVKDHLNTFNHKTNKDEDFHFVSYKTPAYEVKDLLKLNKNGKRSNIAFVTEHASDNEKILGLVTVWDLLDI